MAHITKIKIDGLLDRKEPIDIELRRDVNIFFGDNGGGKTTLLKVLDAAMSQNAEAMHDLAVKRAEVHIFSIDRNKVFKHVWERKDRPKGKKLSSSMETHQFWLDENGEARSFAEPLPPNPWTITPKMQEQTHWAHTFLPTTRLYTDRRMRRASHAITDEELDEIFADNVNKTWLTFYSQVMAQVHTLQESGLRNVVNFALAPKLKPSTGPNHNPAAAYDRVNRFLQRGTALDIALGTKPEFLKRYAKEENLRQIVDSLNTLESEIETAMVPITRFEQTLSNLFSKQKRLLVQQGTKLEVGLKDGSKLSVSQLSSGEKHLLRILLDAMEIGPSSLIIDEPELSMHIDWQRKFVDSVKGINPQCQLIVASHSPEVMADVEDACIFKI